MSSRGLASSVRRCLPATTPLVPPVARTQSAKRRGLETTPAPASDAARPAGGRDPATITISTPWPCPGPRDDG